jgi:phenylalanyl-tRNA synthetase alpha chain
MEDLDQLKSDLLGQVPAADLAALEALRVSALGKSGTITEMMKGIGQLPGDQRRDAGQKLNQVKNAVSDAIDARKSMLEAAALEQSLADDRIDVTLPVRPEAAGRIHPISQTIDEMVAIFCEMGFAVAEGPHIESDFNNFTALNIPPEHPARQDHDTFYLPVNADGERKVLRTHTSPVQIRTMLNEKPPIRIVVPGRTFRADHDATH